ncbi:unnamed protein product, partial [Prorocentrum cordatum]
SSAGSKGHTFSCSSAPLAKPAASKHPEMRGRLRIGCRYQWRGGRPRQAPARTSSCASEPGTPPRDARVPLGTVDRWTQCQTGMTHSAGVCVTLRPTAALPSCPLTADGSQGGSWHCRKTGSG